MNLLTSADAAARLGIERSTFYDWLSQSDSGSFMIRGQETTIAYFQGGRRGQGRIQIEESEVERLLELMKASPRPQRQHNPMRESTDLQHITTKLGRPDD
jgi:hypothetical protein